MEELATKFKEIVMIIGAVFFLAVGICLLIDEIKKGCSTDEHKWSRHTLGNYCLKCGLRRRDYE